MSYDKQYQHVERLGTDEVEGILDGVCYVTPKIDGTNGVVWCEDGVIHAGSRKRELGNGKDNAGFYAAITADPAIKAFFAAHPEATLYGEWLVKHTIKDYEDSAWRHFYVFDVVVDGRYLAPPEYIPMLGLIDYVPVIATLDHPTTEDVMDCLDKATYLMKNDEPGEGIVIHRPDFVNKYGRTVWAKIVRAEFKVACKEKTVETMPSKEAEFVSTYCTEAMILKEQSKIQPWSSKKIPQLLNTVYHELINECIWDYIKKAKNPTLNFRAIQGLCMEKTKEVIGI
jgi:hypothetical protein